MTLKTKILFILPTLTAGGAERVLSFVASNISKEQFSAKLIIIGKSSDAAFEVLGIPVVFLEKDRVINAIPFLIKLLYKEKANIVFSSIGHLNTVLALLSPFFLKTKFIIRVASVISSITKFAKKNKFYSFLAKVSYPWLDNIVCQSRDMEIDFKNLYKVSAKKIITINNPITKKITLKNNKEINNYKNFITVGRLSKEKGHERILELLSKLDYNFTYTIIGTGPQKEFLKEKVSLLNLTGSVEFIDYTSNVYKYLENSDLFLQGSYVEGFPNAVLESNVVGTPVIAFDVPGGTKEIIKNNLNGHLVSNREEYLHLIKETNVKWNRKKIQEHVYSKFDKEIIIKKYEDLFIKVLA